MGTVGLKDKVTVITGANHGMGAATAIALAREGAKVLVNYYRFAAEAYGELADEDMAAATTPGRAYYYKMQMQTAEHVIESIKAFGGTALAIEADLADPTTIPCFSTMLKNIWGRLTCWSTTRPMAGVIRSSRKMN